MGGTGTRPYRAGESIDDLCRACKLTREHTVMAVDGAGRVLRVVCGFCRSEHNYRAIVVLAAAEAAHHAQHAACTVDRHDGVLAGELARAAQVVDRFAWPG